MTVGISLKQGKGLEAIVITDSQVSNFNRQSNSVDKIGLFSNDEYNGVVFGSGNGNIISSVIKNLNQLENPDLEEYVKNIHLTYKNIGDKCDRSYIASQRNEIEKKASLFIPENNLEVIRKNANQILEAQREQYIGQQTLLAQQKYDGYIQQQIEKTFNQYDYYKQQNLTNFVIVGFDKNKEKIRKWKIQQSFYEESYIDHIEIGSGSDGANMYLAEKLQGIDSKIELKTNDLIFFALNAYNSSTINPGVGGKPRIIKVSKESNKSLSSEKITTLVNLSGAYLSEFNEELSSKKTRDYIQDVLEDKENIYSDIAKCLELNINTLKTISIPYSSWQEGANQKLFNGK